MTDIKDFLFNLYNIFKNIISNKIKKKNKNKNNYKNDNDKSSYLINYSNTNIILNDNIEIEDEFNNKNNIYEFIKCKNYDVCNTMLPKIWYEYNNIEICYKCNCLFGNWRGGKNILNQLNIIKCPICLEYKKGISQPRCEHYLCIDCIKRCYYGIDNGEKYIPPIFPYSEKIKKEYENERNNKKWNTEYPLINKYLMELHNYNEVIFIKYKNEKYLRRCHLCRK